MNKNLFKIVLYVLITVLIVFSFFSSSIKVFLVGLSMIISLCMFVYIIVEFFSDLIFGED